MGHQMDSLNQSGLETDKEEEGDVHEFLFPARVRESEEIVISPMKAQEATDCDIADVQGWSKDQRALQLMSYLDETAMNVAQELGDNDLYNYDVLVKLLSDRFDPASRVSAFCSRFHS